MLTSLTLAILSRCLTFAADGRGIRDVYSVAAGGPGAADALHKMVH